MKYTYELTIQEEDKTILKINGGRKDSQKNAALNNIIKILQKAIDSENTNPRPL